MSSPTSPPSPPVTLSPLLQAILDGIESGEIDPRQVDWRAILAGIYPGVTDISPGTTEAPASGFNLGLLIPLVIVSVFMLVLLLCTVRHVWGARCDVTSRRKHSCPSISRMAGESLRSSTRSRHPEDRSLEGSETGQRSLLIPPVITKVGKLGSIRESPEDRYTQGPGDVGVSDKSVRSVLSNVLTDFPYIVSNVGAYPVSDQSHSQDACGSQSHPNLGAPYLSPYITWITPGISQSDPSLPTNSLTELESKLRKGFACKLVQNDNPNTSTEKQKSPYHPNFNTPTNGSENESLPSNVVINGSTSLLAASGGLQVKPEMLALKGVPHLPSLLLHRQSLPSCNTSTPGVCSASKPSSLDGTCLSAQLSCPSSVGSWHYNDLYHQPGQGVPPMKTLLTQALLNSASRPLHGEILDPNHFLADTQQMNVAACQPSIVSMFPNVGSSNNSFQNNGPHTKAGSNTSRTGSNLSQTANSSCQTSEQGIQPSTNTSLCGHMDSCETSDNYSSMVTTGVHSDQVSGYIAGPSHSTSIEKNSTLSHVFSNPSSELQSGSSTENSSNCSVQAMSAIQNSTLNSEMSSGQQVFHQALSLDGTNASITLSFASTAKSAPAALHYNIYPQAYLQPANSPYNHTPNLPSSHTPTLPSAGRSTALSSALSNQVYSTGSGSTTPTIITQLERPISNLSSDPSVASRSTNPFLQSAPVPAGEAGRVPSATSSGTYEWDFYPFSADDATKSSGAGTPEVMQQFQNTAQETVVTCTSDNTTTTQHRRRSNQPLLADAQYWV